MSRFGVWYDEGGLDCGWLAEEHNHGRQYRIEYSTLEEAEACAERQRYYDKNTVFYAAPLDMDHEELFKKVRKIVNSKKLKDAERKLERAKAAVAADDEEKRTAFEQIFDEDDP